MSDDAPISILLIDDHELIRDGLGAVIDLEDDLDVVGTAATVAEGLQRYAELQPDVVITDLQMQDGTDHPQAERQGRPGRADHARR